MSGPHFLALAYRVTAFQGVVAARVARAAREQEEQDKNATDLAQNLDVIDYG